MFLLNVFILISFQNSINCARILIVNSHPGYSHQLVYNRIAEELSKRGHDIVSITTIPMNNTNLKNIREIDISSTKEVWIKSVNTVKPDIFNKVLKLYECLVDLVDIQLQQPEVQELIKNETERFDLVILAFLSAANFGYKYRFNCPLIGVLPMDATNVEYTSVGNGLNSAIYPDIYIYKPISNDLLRRFYNFCMNSIIELHAKFVLDVLSTKVMRKNFAEDYPDTDVLRRDVDLLFVNSNRVINYQRSVNPCTVSVSGGMHIETPKELSKDLKSILDKSTRGVIYMSFGTNIHSSKIPKRILEVFFKTFAELPYDILWKYESEVSRDVPKNVHLRKWLPQQDILRHKNIKLFITHGGIKSTEEAILNHVPMLSSPFYADQLHNSHKIAEREIGLLIDNLEALTPERLKSLIMELVQNPMYKNNTKKLSAILTDQPMTPMETIVWWTEYVLRHKGAKHLRGPDLPFYQLYLLDVLGMLLLLLLIILFILYKLLRCVYRKVSSLIRFRKVKVS